MKKLETGLAYLIAINIEAAVIILVAWVVAEWANSSYPQKFSWITVAIPVALLIIIKQWYTVIKKLIDSHGNTHKK